MMFVYTNVAAIMGGAAGPAWLLAGGVWSDSGVWSDDAVWID